jgi:hypothetical protein
MNMPPSGQPWPVSHIIAEGAERLCELQALLVATLRGLHWCTNLPSPSVARHGHEFSDLQQQVQGLLYQQRVSAVQCSAVQIRQLSTQWRTCRRLISRELRVKEISTFTSSAA